MGTTEMMMPPPQLAALGLLRAFGTRRNKSSQTMRWRPVCAIAHAALARPSA